MRLSKERLGKIFLYISADIIVVIFSVLFAIVLWRQGFVPGSHIIGVTFGDWKWFGYTAAAAAVLTVTVNSVFHLYDNLWKYASIDEVIKIFIASAVVFVLLYIFDLFIISPMNLNNISRRMYFIAWASDTFLIMFSRFGYRLVKRLAILISHAISSKSGLRRVMVVGASFSGYGIIREIKTSRVRDRIPVLVVDPDLSKNNTSIMGVRVIGGMPQIPELAERYEIDEIIIAMPSAAPEELREAVDLCTGTNCRLKIMPPISDVTDSSNAYSHLRDVNISDLLHREEIKLDTKNISDYLKNKVVLVTGGGGSIGSELCRQIAKFSPKTVVIFDIYENNAFELLNELMYKYGGAGAPGFVIRIGSVQDKARLAEVFNEYQPHVVFHTAAHKHVMIMEENQTEAVKNNCVGTRNAALAAHEFGAERFVLISSDKAVNPANAYGATKRVAELLVQGMAAKSKTKFITVRFGNVLGSNGSVLPVFKQQIAMGGPVKITGDPNIVRYFMTIPEAAQLVLQAAGLAQSGKILVLNMGTPLKIEDLARKIIHLSGYRPGADIEIAYFPPRPGDKQYEELIMEEEKENMRSVCHNKIFITKPLQIDYEKFDKQFMRLKTAAEKSPGDVNKILKEMVPNYGGQ